MRYSCTAAVQKSRPAPVSGRSHPTPRDILSTLDDFPRGSRREARRVAATETGRSAPVFSPSPTSTRGSTYRPTGGLQPTCWCRDTCTLLLK